MPISKSAKKSLRVSITKTSRNRYRKALLKDALKKADSSSVALVDKAAKWGIIHPNKAARLKSQLSKVIKTTPAKEKTLKEKATKPKTAAKKSATKKTTKK